MPVLKNAQTLFKRGVLQLILPELERSMGLAIDNRRGGFSTA
jgi:hypothetical protein